VPITGVHALLYTSEPEELRRLLAEAFGWASVDAGAGWLVYALPPSELGVHPGAGPGHELSLMCDDLARTMAELAGRGVAFRGEPERRDWGDAVTMILPGDVEMLLYQPRHPTAHGR
jgi:hypothetical protein